MRRSSRSALFSFCKKKSAKKNKSKSILIDSIEFSSNPLFFMPFAVLTLLLVSPLHVCYSPIIKFYTFYSNDPILIYVIISYYNNTLRIYNVCFYVH